MTSGASSTARTSPIAPSSPRPWSVFRPDSWGNTFFFVDMNYQREGITSAYWEISREFSLGKLPLALHYPSTTAG